MDILNLRVKHKVFGEGVIVDVCGSILTIQFSSRKSKFIYPDCFEGYIVAEDTSIHAAIISEIKMAKLAKRERQEKENAITPREMQNNAVPSARKCRSIEEGFGPDYHVQYLARQPILTYQQVEEQFGIKITGFGRGINRTSSTVVLISSVDRKKTGFVYHDRWTTEGDYIYSGEGKTGDQTMTSGNKAIVDAERDGKLIHLFVKFSPQEYYYQGVFTLVGYTYEDDNDEVGNLRKEYKFRLKKQS